MQLTFDPFWAICIVTVTICIILFRWWFQAGSYTDEWVRIDGKVVIITGANTGIGKETALELARRGAKVYMACRDMQKAEAARLRIIEKTGNSNVFCRSLDLASLESVRKFAQEFLAEESRLNILINNAGVMYARGQTEDGFEIQIGINHMGHFLLTNLLLDCLIASAPSRIITLSSIAHHFGVINRKNINGSSVYDSYSQSKLANILFTRELSKRLHGTGVTANSAHPGIVYTELARYIPIIRIIITPFLLIFAKTPKGGAQTTLKLALDPAMEKISGNYYGDCELFNEAPAARDDETADWLWRVSEEWTMKEGLEDPESVIVE